MGLRYPHEWDIFFYSKGGAAGRARAVREAGPVLREPHPPRPEHHPFEEADPHDRGFKGLKLRVPGGMIAEGFAAIGAGPRCFPAVRCSPPWRKARSRRRLHGPGGQLGLGFQQVTNYIWTGPRDSIRSISRSTSWTSACGMDCWNKLSPKMKQWLDDEIQVYSNMHHAAIQKADMETWPKFERPGPRSTACPPRTCPSSSGSRCRSGSSGRTGTDAARIFKLQLEVMESPTVGYVTPNMYKGQKLERCRRERPGGPRAAGRSLPGAARRCRSLRVISRKSAHAEGRFGMPTLNFVCAHWMYWGNSAVPGRRDVPGGQAVRHGARASRSSSTRTSSGSPPDSRACTASTSRSCWGLAFVPLFARRGPPQQRGARGARRHVADVAALEQAQTAVNRPGR